MSRYAPMYDSNTSGYDAVENAGYAAVENQGYDTQLDDAMFANGYQVLINGGYTVFENAGYEQVFLDACVQLLPELEPAFLRQKMAAALAPSMGKPSLWRNVAGVCIGLVQVVAGVVVLIVASPLTLLAASASGALIGGGVSCVLYSISAGESFDWKDFGKSLVVGVATGAVSGGVGFKAAEAIGQGAIATVRAGMAVGAAAGVASGAVGSAVKQALDLVDGTTDTFDVVDVLLCATKGAIIGGCVGGVSVKLGLAGNTNNNSNNRALVGKAEAMTKVQAFTRLVSKVSVGGAAGAGGQMLENAFRGDPAFENVVNGLVIGATVAGTMYLLENGVKLSMRRVQAQDQAQQALTLEEETRLAVAQAEQRLANRERIRAHFEDAATGRRVPDSMLRNTQFRPNNLHAQVAGPDLVVDGVEYFHVGYRGMSQEAYDAAVANGHAPVNAGGAGGARFGRGLYVADTYEDAQSYAFQMENRETQQARGREQYLYLKNIGNRAKWEAQWVQEGGAIRTDAELQQIAAPRASLRPIVPLGVPRVTPQFVGAVVCDVFLPRQVVAELTYAEIGGNEYALAVHNNVDVLHVATDLNQTRIAPAAAHQARLFLTPQHNQRLFDPDT